MPADGRLQFNVMRGTLAGGRYGVLFHKLLGISVRWDSVRGRYEADSGADLVGLHYEAQGRAKVRSLLALLPVVGPLVEPANRGDPRPSQVGVPVTVGAAAVPEVATVADFRCGNRLHRGKLDRAEQHSTPVRGIHLQRTDGHDPDPDFVARLMATPLVDILREYAERPFFRLTVDHAQLSIELDGFSYAPSELDALGDAVSRGAASLAAAGRPLHRPRPFNDVLPSVEWAHEPNPLQRTSFEPPLAWIPSLSDLARRYSGVAEDPVAYHLAHPGMPVPGRAFAVLALPGPTGVQMRLAWHAEQRITRYNTGRNAVLLPLSTAPDTSAGSVRVQELDVNYAVSGGVLHVWERRDWNANGGLGDMDGLVIKARQLASQLPT